MQKLLFLCTGNYYRSRFAEIFFNWHADSRGIPWRADSRGLALDPANPGAMSVFTRTHLGRYPISLAEYERLPQDLTSRDLDAAHHIVAVKRTEHHPLMQRRFPDWLDRVEFWEVHDIDCQSPDAALPHLEREVLSLVDRLAAMKRPSR